jgi:hypothetical protein
MKEACRHSIWSEIFLTPHHHGLHSVPGTKAWILYTLVSNGNPAPINKEVENFMAEFGKMKKYNVRKKFCFGTLFFT